MANYQFVIPTVEEARKTLSGRSYQAEMWHDAVSCARRLMPVTLEAECVAVKSQPPRAETFGCVACGKFAFASPGVRCFGCRRAVSSQTPAVEQSANAPEPLPMARPAAIYICRECRFRPTEPGSALCLECAEPDGMFNFGQSGALDS